MLSELRQDQVLRSTDEGDPDTVAWLLKNIAEIDMAVSRIAELEARLSAVIAGEILPADAADEIVVDGVKWVRVPAERRVVFLRDDEE